VNDFRRLRRAAVAAVDLRGPEFAPYLAKTFPAGMAHSVSYAQAYFARALAARDDLWDGTVRGVAEMFQAAGLLEERARWRTAGGSVTLLEEPLRAVRENPRTFVGAGPADADLLPRLLELVRATGASVELDGRTAFRAARHGRIDVPDLLRGDPIGPRVAVALSLGITVLQEVGGVVFRPEFVERVPVGPARRSARAPSPTPTSSSSSSTRTGSPDGWWRMRR
jgi:hypothetical protein